MVQKQGHFSSRFGWGRIGMENMAGRTTQLSFLSELVSCVCNQKGHSHASIPKLLPLPELAGRLPLFLNSLQHYHLLKETWKLPLKVNEVDCSCLASWCLSGQL